MAQELHTFKAPTLSEAYQLMRAQLGEQAVVLRTQQVKEGGVLGFMAQTQFVVTAAAPTAATPRKLSAAERKYAASSVGSDENVTNTVAYFQKLVEQAQQRMKQPRPVEPAPPLSGNTPMSPLLHFQKPAPKPNLNEELQRELHEMRDLLQVLAAEAPGAGLPTEFAPHYRMLLEQGVTRRTAAALVSAVVKDSDLKVMRDPRVFTERLKVEIRRRLVVSGGIALRGGACTVAALVGPTGVGKTTSLAKLAAAFAIRERARVALITADTYRVAAPEQLRVYANIIGLPMKVVNEAHEMAEAVREFRDYDLVLIDTAGASPFNVTHMQELKSLLEVARPEVISLVLSANTQLEDLRQTLLSYGCLKPTDLMFTKLDETRRYGSMLSILIEMELPLGYCTNGQNVPDDLVLAQPGTVANLLMEGRDNRGRSSAAAS